MPIYEYECPVCGTFEQIQKFSDAPLTACPRCAAKGLKNEVHRLISTSAFHLKGSGWYKTDYAKPSGKPKKDTSSDKSSGKEKSGEKSAAGESGSKSTEASAGSTAEKPAPAAKNSD